MIYYMDYPLTEEQIEKIKKCLGSSHVLIYGLLKEDQREALNFLISHRFVVNSSQVAINGYGNQFYPIASVTEILRQINEENTRILNERAKVEKAERRDSNIGKATLIVSILALIVGIIGLF